MKLKGMITKSHIGPIHTIGTEFPFCGNNPCQSDKEGGNIRYGTIVWILVSTSFLAFISKVMDEFGPNFVYVSLRLRKILQLFLVLP